ATGGGLPFTLYVLPHFLDDLDVARGRDADGGDETTGRLHATTETHVLALACSTQKKADDYDDKIFLAEARQVVEDMCLLLSLLAGGMITWHCYYQSGKGLLIRHNRSLSGEPGSARTHEIVPSWDLRGFLRRGFKQM